MNKRASKSGGVFCYLALEIFRFICTLLFEIYKYQDRNMTFREILALLPSAALTLYANGSGGLTVGFRGYSAELELPAH